MAGRALAQEETTNWNEGKFLVPKPWTSFRAHALLRMIQREGDSLVQLMGPYVSSLCLEVKRICIRGWLKKLQCRCH